VINYHNERRLFPFTPFTNLCFYPQQTHNILFEPGTEHMPHNSD